MAVLFRAAILALVVALPASTAGAVELLPSRPLGPKVGGLPRVAGDDPVAHRINATLQQAEDRLGRAMRDCGQFAAQSGRPAAHS